MHVLFFGHLKAITHCAEMTLPCPEADADGVWRKLLEVYPGLEPCRRSVRLAKNSEYVGREARFTDQDEVALIPPVSGG